MLLLSGLKHVLVLLAVAWLVDSRNVTERVDVLALEELRELVLASGMQLTGWVEGNLDPCGHLRCGINDFNVNCNWEGLACLEILDTPGVARVVGIEIKGQVGGRRLEGQLPRMLPPKLKSLSLPDNHMRGTLDDTSCQLDCHDQWHNLNTLEIINLGGNNITGKLPEWKELGILKIIRLQNNQLTGYLPDMWVKKEKLAELDMSNNRLQGELPPRWGGFESLNKLRLDGNLFKNSIPEKWFSMKELRLLDVTGNCALCGTVPDDLKFSLRADGTNLNNACSSCNDCECSGKSWTVIFNNALISFAVLLALVMLYFARRVLSRRCSDERDLEAQNSFLPNLYDETHKVEVPTLIVMPDGQEICMGKKLEDKTSDDSSIHFSSNDSASSSSGEDEDDPKLYEMEDDPRVLSFIQNEPASSTYYSWHRDDDTDSLSYGSGSTMSDSEEGYETDIEHQGSASEANMGRFRGGNRRGRHMMSVETLPDKFPEPPHGPPGGLPSNARDEGPSQPSTMASADSAPVGWPRSHAHRRSHSDVPDTFPEPPSGPPERSAISSDFNGSNHPPVARSSSEKLRKKEYLLHQLRNGNPKGKASASGSLRLDRHPRVSVNSPRESVPNEWPSPPRRRMPLSQSGGQPSSQETGHRAPKQWRAPAGEGGSSRQHSGDVSLSLSPRNQMIPRIVEESPESGSSRSSKLETGKRAAGKL
ncbi:hypothetical protein BSKO_07054 [Bryopsis sp. KO-2023]|nr:hypothetical protein BSKO_07054 [Bryopsis sp. KO-2023]